MGETAAPRDLPRVPPLEASGWFNTMEPGVPPRSGVQNLVFTQTPSGLRSMTYSFDGDDFYMNYTPSETANCYDFETRRITDGGDTYTGELCR